MVSRGLPFGRLFQIVVHGVPVLIFNGKSERDAVRYLVREAGRLVFKFKGDVLAAQDSNFRIYRATPAQSDLWVAGFRAAVRAGELQADDPAGFAVVPA